MTFTRIEGGPLGLTSLRSALKWSGKSKIARSKSTARGPITVWRSSTIPTNIRPSSVRPISRWGASSVNTKSTAPSRTMKVNFRSCWLRSTKLIWTSTCSTSRLSGAHIARMTTTVKFVSMRTTGKTSADALRLSFIQARCARTGKSTTSSALIQKGVKASISAYTRMGGRSKNITLTSWKLSSVSTAPTARSHTARTSIASMIDRCPCPSGSAASQSLVLQPFLQTGTWAAMVLNRIIWLINRPLFRACRHKSYAIRSGWTKAEDYLRKVASPRAATQTYLTLGAACRSQRPFDRTTHPLLMYRAHSHRTVNGRGETSAAKMPSRSSLTTTLLIKYNNRKWQRGNSRIHKLYQTAVI